MSETLESVVAPTTKRPTFLTVLCILTFIGSGWGIISSLVMKDPGLTEYAGYYYWVVLLLNLGTLYGALQMWKLKKMGLYIWTAAEVLSIVLMWVVIKGYIASLTAPVMDGIEGSDEFSSLMQTGSSAMIEGVMNTALMIGSIFPAVFVVLYWLNAKHLK